MKKELTDRLLRTLKAPDEGRIEISDTKRIGLRLRLYAKTAHRAKPRAVWMYEKRIKNGPKRKHTLGLWPAVGLKEARELALELEAEASKGVDRVAIARAQMIADEAARASLVTVQNALNIYDELHLTGLRTRDERRRQLEQSLKPHLNKSVKDITRKDLQHAIDAKAQSGRKAYANRIRAALVAFANWLWSRGYLDENIGVSIAKATKEQPRERVLSLPEVQQIWIVSEELGPLWSPIIRMLLLTGQRRGEILNLRWEEIDFVASQMVKDGTKTKNGKAHTTHLSKPAVNELYNLSPQKAGFVFTTTGQTPVSGIGKAKARLDDLLGDMIQPWRLHDIRTAFATALANSGELETVVDRILNHSASGSSPSKVARVYNQADLLPQRARALDRWADMVTNSESKVVKIHG